MEAKEIVVREVARQSEFGHEPSWEDFVIAGQRNGIKEVVEEIEKEFLLLTVISPPLLEPIITVLRNVKSKWGINP